MESSLIAEYSHIRFTEKSLEEFRSYLRVIVEEADGAATVPGACISRASILPFHSGFEEILERVELFRIHKTRVVVDLTQLRRD
jgi:hypothetical protein